MLKHLVRSMLVCLVVALALTPTATEFAPTDEAPEPTWNESEPLPGLEKFVTTRLLAETSRMATP